MFSSWCEFEQAENGWAKDGAGSEKIVIDWPVAETTAPVGTIGKSKRLFYGKSLPNLHTIDQS